MNIQELLEAMGESVKDYGTGPLFEEMPRHTLMQKGMAGSTAAHTIEELHAPTNIAYTTYTTGTTAFQNIVGVTHNEIPRRRLAGKRALELAGVKEGDKLLITYAPLVNVFSGEPMEYYGVDSQFMLRPNRDAFLYSLCTFRPQVVIGESSFIRAALADAEKMGLHEAIPENLIFLAAGTPLDMELIDEAKKLTNAQVHDLYGCQEFGWLTLDGIPVRDDMELVPLGENGEAHLVVGGLPTGDVFRLGSSHVLNPKGNVVTYSRVRSSVFWEVKVIATTASDVSTLQRAATSILRLKGRIVRIDPNILCNTEKNQLVLVANGQEEYPITGEVSYLFDDLLQAQIDYQGKKKVNAVWNKEEYKP